MPLYAHKGQGERAEQAGVPANSSSSGLLLRSWCVCVCVHSWNLLVICLGLLAQHICWLGLVGKSVSMHVRIWICDQICMVSGFHVNMQQ